MGLDVFREVDVCGGMEKIWGAKNEKNEKEKGVNYKLK